MNCQEAQEAILLSDNPADFTSNPELAKHVTECAACSEISLQLSRMQTAMATFPMPGSAEGKAATLKRVRSFEMRPRRLILHPMFLSAVAALIVVGVGLGIVIYNFDRPAPPTVVDRLIDWNAELADAPATQQSAVFSARAAVLQSEVHDASLSDDDRELASALLQHGNWLCVNTDPIDRAEKFSDLSDLILIRMHRAVLNNDEKAMQRLSLRYDQVVRAGIGGNLARMKANAAVSPENTKKLERIAKRNADQERKLQLLNDRASKALQKELKQALETSKKQGKNMRGQGRVF